MQNFSLLKSPQELRAWLDKKNSSINFVPTMGGLHQGHSKLIQHAKNIDSLKQYPSVLVSIFVNPLQFGGNEDFDQYPRNLESDIETAKKSGADALWAPSISDIFPKGIDGHCKLKAPKSLNQSLCGAQRKKHFDGVATIIIRLLSIIKPDRLFLGEKDWQQLIIIKQLIEDLSIPTKIYSIATARDFNGMAYSSRNQYLSTKEKEQAVALPKALISAAKEFRIEKELNLKKIKDYLQNNQLEVEYLKIVDPYLLKEPQNDCKLKLLAAAVRCGETRLIDHIFLMTRNPIIAIDGPAGAGKSTITKGLARKLGLVYLDTGAMYRAVTWLIKEEKINLENEIELKNLIENIKIEFKSSNNNDQLILINGHDVSDQIRKPEITSYVSTIAAISSVREVLTEQQKLIGNKGGLIAEGRDIGSAVFPDAELKIFLTATASERAKRRAKDLEIQGFKVANITQIENEIKQRDYMDSNREIAPLLKADDAIEVVTDGMSIDEVINRLIYLFRSKIPEEVWSTPG